MFEQTMLFYIDITLQIADIEIEEDIFYLKIVFSSLFNQTADLLISN